MKLKTTAEDRERAIEQGRKFGDVKDAVLTPRAKWGPDAAQDIETLLGLLEEAEDALGQTTHDANDHNCPGKKPFRARVFFDKCDACLGESVIAYARKRIRALLEDQEQS